MKRYAACTLLTLSLTGCATLFSSHTTAPIKRHEEARPVTKVDLLMKQASSLADEVKNGQMSRTQAADKLGDYRVSLVGNNAIDDEMFGLYRHLAIERDASRMTARDSSAQMEAKLREWLRRWSTMAVKPKPSPVFTNFLLKLYSLPPLD